MSDLNMIFAAWLQDRAEQYANDSPSRAAIEELVAKVLAGEPEAAHRHGELDDIMRRMAR